MLHHNYRHVPGKNAPAVLGRGNCGSDALSPTLSVPVFNLQDYVYRQEVNVVEPRFRLVAQILPMVPMVAGFVIFRLFAARSSGMTWRQALQNIFR